jgi:hypothetical protein
MAKSVFAGLLCLCFVSGGYGQLPVTDGLIIHLRADSLTGLQDGDPVALWIDSAQDDPVDGTVRDVGSGTPQYKAEALYGKPVVRFNGAEALSSAQFSIPDVQAGVTAVAVATGDKSGALHERLAHFGAYDAVGGTLIALDVCTQQGTNEGSGFRLNNGWSLAGNPNPMDTNFHVGVWQAAQGTKQSALVFYLDGVQQTLRQNNPNNTVTFSPSGNVVAVGGGHSPGGAFYSGDFVTADLAVLLVYNRVLSAAEVATLTQYLRNEYLVHKAAANPQPASGALLSETHVTLTWDSGEGAAAHRVYLSANRDAVANGEETALMPGTIQPPVLLGTAGQLMPEGLTPGLRYFWRVDEVAADGGLTAGPVWSFNVPPTTAYDPVPAEGGAYVRLDQTLSWKSGLGALLHTVYIGTDANAVAEAAGGTAQAENSFALQGLEPGRTYSWRVDETTVGGVVKGPVWDFTTVGVIPIEDESLLGWWTMDQVGSVAIPDMSGHNLHGTVQGQIDWTAGVDGNAIELTADDLITTPPANVTTDTITMTAWIKPAQVHGRTGIIFMRAGASTTGLNLMPDNQLGYHWLDAAESWQYTSGLIVPVEEWSFVAMVVVPEKVTLYLDGVEIARELARLHDPVTFSGNLTLGSDTLEATRRFVGALDDLRFYIRALSAEEVAALAAAVTKPERETNPLAVDDFDAYNAYNDEGGANVWDVWSDGYGGNGTGSTAGYVQEPFMTRSIVLHAGQALPLGYDNTGQFTDLDGNVARVLLSEITRAFQPAQDFTRSGSTGVTLWIQGDVNNTVEAGDILYLGVKDAAGQEAVATVAPAADLCKFYWLQKSVPFTQLAGVDLTQVTDLFLGVGTRAAPATGGRGTVIIDGIVLTAE